MSYWRFNPEDYAVGSSLYVADGYSNRTVAEYTVTRATPSGQIVATLNSQPDRSIRVNRHGIIIGDDSWSTRGVVSAETAAEIARKEAVRRAWVDVRSAAEKVDKAARLRDEEQLAEAMTALVASVAALTPSKSTDIQRRLG